MDDDATAMVTLGPDFRRALVVAAEKHERQRRKGSGEPYVGHLLAVAAIVIEAGGTETEAIAALLHDVVEDQPVSLADLAEMFSAEVARIVGECSEDKGDGDRPWRIRKEEYVAHLATASPSGLLVSLADKIHNSRSILRDYRTQGELVWERFNPEADQLWYYPRLVEEFETRAAEPGLERLRPLVEELRDAVTELVDAVRGAPHPIPGAYWLVPGRLLAGPYPIGHAAAATRRLRRLRWSGVDCYLDLTEEGEHGLVPYAELLDDGCRRLRFPIGDFGVPTEPQMNAILDAIDAALASGSTVYLHCSGGLGRTGTVAGCYLVRRGMSDEEALARVAALCRDASGTPRHSPETDAQRALVLSWSG